METCPDSRKVIKKTKRTHHCRNVHFHSEDMSEDEIWNLPYLLIFIPSLLITKPPDPYLFLLSLQVNKTLFWGEKGSFLSERGEDFQDSPFFMHLTAVLPSVHKCKKKGTWIVNNYKWWYSITSDARWVRRWHRRLGESKGVCSHWKLKEDTQETPEKRRRKESRQVRHLQTNTKLEEYPYHYSETFGGLESLLESSPYLSGAWDGFR